MQLSPPSPDAHGEAEQQQLHALAGQQQERLTWMSCHVITWMLDEVTVHKITWDLLYCTGTTVKQSRQ
jgi:hypothetical protein